MEEAGFIFCVKVVEGGLEVWGFSSGRRAHHYVSTGQVRSEKNSVCPREAMSVPGVELKSGSPKACLWAGWTVVVYGVVLLRGGRSNFGVGC